ncbi:2-oxoacid:ferredoxin oxidoreductase, gamma subunit [Desulfosporosinus acidiphilus SJ4]|uniref:2-oxoacid:ferredoxin oxidoreductase, gamma subunit n=1 Tax=Desulfosporosinus acidiphilus (strain DSM 22704 / JCM 16185 / SJ4) TaxID=646529 RepID=I4D400_DESAJ|nr:indolepyruvate oxidoreductase subunit beta [Desulfosporosinus acidiphilus]AFM40524.1 2-oxoacid:ferredoxin oxidoreductase, gamma subunit [Desulfosporosinus acidiphilus SJ4]
MNKKVMLVGVGGQGTILTSKILAEGLLRAGYDVKMSEIHGMAQRGGSVTTHIIFGKKVASPIIDKGEADVLVAFEKVEALRYIDHLKLGGTIILNDHEIYSQTVLSGAEAYPQGIIENLQKAVDHVVTLKAVAIAEQAGNVKTQNIVLLGALVNVLDLKDIPWQEVIQDLVPAKLLEVNLRAFQAGLDI